ncbi:hypothetical protein ACU5P1_11465 [Pseudomonas plecoglossicida]|uniref:LysR family transcriptional regulator n=1 Tax=Pseudomonas plecoglossicida TaxID=70775 RepID=A0AAD0QS00_PSEDL|nr:LysR family transcriptional regulator [Pseudomonas plecoglossicida]AXM94655.1 hypothetical protein DVB73_01840 [Pseudomonas plecoglossicida]EPB93752.1 LysR family transcriptional regulator [Pseudomonas plecoglossicida NB2011]QLB55392.1 hypothetical protein HAV28_11375 [Pseudomonas plecoglossicida]GLR34946.1 hypothetical protein GCM10011247_03430 [Pseudomonas plecoglossicida]
MPKPTPNCDAQLLRTLHTLLTEAFPAPPNAWGKANPRSAWHYAELLPLRIEPLPAATRPLRYYQLWHARKHRAQASKWLRGLVLASANAIA